MTSYYYINLSKYKPVLYATNACTLFRRPLLVHRAASRTEFYSLTQQTTAMQDNPFGIGCTQQVAWTVFFCKTQIIISNDRKLFWQCEESMIEFSYVISTRTMLGTQETRRLPSTTLWQSCDTSCNSSSINPMSKWKQAKKRLMIFITSRLT